MTWDKGQLISSILVFCILVLAGFALSANWSWLAGFLIALSLTVIAPKPLS